MKMILICDNVIKTHSSQGVFAGIVSPNPSLISFENCALAQVLKPGS